MSEFKGTKGEWKCNTCDGIRITFENLTIDVWFDGMNEGLFNGETYEQGKSNAELIAEAGNVRQRINFSLTELLEQRNELLKALEKAEAVMAISRVPTRELDYASTLIKEICTLIKKCHGI